MSMAANLDDVLNMLSQISLGSDSQPEDEEDEEDGEEGSRPPTSPKTEQEPEEEEHEQTPRVVYPWDQSNFNQYDIENMAVSNGVIRRRLSQFNPERKKAETAAKLRDLTEEYHDATGYPFRIQPDADIVRLGDQQQYFRPHKLKVVPGCEDTAAAESELYETSRLETQSLNQEWALKNQKLLERIGAFSPALGLLLERPVAIVTQSAFVKRLDAQIKYEIEKCECPPPAHLTSWLFDFVRTDTIGNDEPELNISEEPTEKLMGRFKIYQKAFTLLIHHFVSLRPILRDIKRTYEALLFMRDRQIREILVVKKSIEQYEKLLDVKREEIRAEGYAQLNQLQQQCFLLMRHVDRQDAAIETMTEMLVEIERCLGEENHMRVASEESRKDLIVEINILRRKYGLFGPSFGSAPPGALLEGAPEEAERAHKHKDKKDDDKILQSDDRVLLRSTLESTRKALSEAQHRITILEADYSDVIPKEDYNAVKKQADVLMKSHAETMEEYNEASSQLQELKNQIESLSSDSNSFREKIDQLQRTGTPRPSWNKIQRLIESENPENKWEDVYNGNSTRTIAEKLVEHITGKKVEIEGHSSRHSHIDSQDQLEPGSLVQEAPEPDEEQAEQVTPMENDTNDLL